MMAAFATAAAWASADRDVQGAIEDFEFALEHAEAEYLGDEFITSRTAWAKALREGQDPAVIFDEATLQEL